MGESADNTCTRSSFLGRGGSHELAALLSSLFLDGITRAEQSVHNITCCALRSAELVPLLKTLGRWVVLLLYFSVGVGVKAFVLSGRLPPLASPDQATPSLLLNVTPIVLAALVFSGVAAATMSAANSFINIGAAIVTHDLPVAFGRRVKTSALGGDDTLIAVAARSPRNSRARGGILG